MDVEKSADWRESDRGVFLVNVLGIVYDPNKKQILIGRREKDPYIKELSWVFPGGRPGYEKEMELEDYLKREVKKKTNLDVKDFRIVFSKTYPEKREFLSIYYFCVLGEGEARPGESFVELKWVNPTEVKNYFTTSLHPKVYEFLEKLERGEEI